MEEQLKKVIERALEVAEQTGQFVVDQAPELIHEFYAWHLFFNSFSLCAGLLLCVMAAILLRKGMDYCDGEINELLGDAFGYALPALMLAIFGLVAVIEGGTKLVKLVMAPNIYLIEHFIH